MWVAGIKAEHWEVNCCSTTGWTQPSACTAHSTHTSWYIYTCTYFHSPGQHAPSPHGWAGPCQRWPGCPGCLPWPPCQTLTSRACACSPHQLFLGLGFRVEPYILNSSASLPAAPSAQGQLRSFKPKNQGLCGDQGVCSSCQLWQWPCCLCPLTGTSAKHGSSNCFGAHKPACSDVRLAGSCTRRVRVSDNEMNYIQAPHAKIERRQLVCARQHTAVTSQTPTTHSTLWHDTPQAHQGTHHSTRLHNAPTIVMLAAHRARACTSSAGSTLFLCTPSWAANPIGGQAWSPAGADRAVCGSFRLGQRGLGLRGGRLGVLS